MGIFDPIRVAGSGVSVPGGLAAIDQYKGFKDAIIAKETRDRLAIEQARQAAADKRAEESLLLQQAANKRAEDEALRKQKEHEQVELGRTAVKDALNPTNYANKFTQLQEQEYGKLTDQLAKGQISSSAYDKELARLNEAAVKASGQGMLNKVFDANAYSKNVYEQVLGKTGDVKLANEAAKTALDRNTRQLSDIDKLQYQTGAAGLQTLLKSAQDRVNDTAVTKKVKVGNDSSTKKAAQIRTTPGKVTGEVAKYAKDVLKVDNSYLNASGEERDLPDMMKILNQPITLEGGKKVYLTEDAQKKVLLEATNTKNWIAGNQINEETLPLLMKKAALEASSNGVPVYDETGTETTLTTKVADPNALAALKEAQSKYAQGIDALNAQYGQGPSAEAEFTRLFGKAKEKSIPAVSTKSSATTSKSDVNKTPTVDSNTTTNALDNKTQSVSLSNLLKADRQQDPEQIYLALVNKANKTKDDVQQMVSLQNEYGFKPSQYAASTTGNNSKETDETKTKYDSNPLLNVMKGPEYYGNVVYDELNSKIKTGVQGDINNSFVNKLARKTAGVFGDEQDTNTYTDRSLLEVKDAFKAQGIKDPLEIAYVAQSLEPEAKDAALAFAHDSLMRSDPDYRKLMADKQLKNAGSVALSALLTAATGGGVIGGALKAGERKAAEKAAEALAKADQEALKAVVRKLDLRKKFNVDPNQWTSAGRKIPKQWSTVK